MGTPDGDGGGDRLRRAARVVGYATVGLLVTALLTVVGRELLLRVRPVVFEFVYLRAGPSVAAETASLVHFLLAVVTALGVSMLAGDALDDRLDHVTAIGATVAAMLVPVAGLVVAALAGVDPYLPTVLVTVVVVAGVPLVPLALLGVGVRSGAVPAFVGGTLVVVVLLVPTVSGIALGWGYVLTAEEVPPSSVEGPAADFDEVPAVRDELFDGENCEAGDDGRECRLNLRGYEHERAAARFLDRHGARCPSRTTRGRSAAVVAEHDGRFYRVTCVGFGF